MTDPVTINTPDLHRNIFAKLHALQRQGVACDVILAAVDGEILAHKVILMAVSTYFCRRLTTMLLEEKHPKLFIQGISITELASIVKYIYSGKLLVGTDSIDATLQVCEMLELDDVIKGYGDVMSRKTLTINAVYAPTNVDTLESTPSIPSDEKQELHSRTASKQSTGLIESEVIDLSEDDGLATEIQITSNSRTTSKQTTVYAPSHVDTLESTPSIPSDEKQELLSRTASKQSTGLIESEVIDLSEDDGLATEIQITSKTYQSTNRKGKPASINSSPNVLGAFKDAEDKYPSNISAVSVKQTLEYKGDEATVLNKDSEESVYNSSFPRDTNTLLCSRTVNASRKQDSIVDSHVPGCRPTCTNVTRGRIISVPSSVKKLKVSAMRDYSFDNELKDSSKTQTVFSVSDKPGSHYNDKVSIPKAARQTVKPISLIRRDNFLSSTAVHCSLPQCDRGVAEDSSIGQNAFCLCSSNSAVIPMNIYKNVSNVEEATRYDKQPGLLQKNLDTGMSKPVIETRFISKEHRVAYTEDKQIHLPLHLTEKAMESDTTLTDKFDGGTISGISVTSQADLGFEASAYNSYLEHTRKNLKNVGPSPYERHTENKRSSACMDDSCTITDTCERTQVSKKPYWFMHESPRAATLISYYHRDCKELLPSTEFPEKRMKKYSEKNLQESSDLEKKISRAIKSDHKSGFKSTSNVQGHKKRKVGTQCRPVVILRKLSEHEIMSWSTNKTQVRELVKKVRFPRVKLIERRNRSAQLLNDQRSQGDSTADLRWLCGNFNYKNSLYQKRPEPALSKQTRSGKAVANKYSYKSSGISDDVLSLKSFRCDVCQFKTTKESEYRFHMKRVHGKSSVYRCSADGCSFSTYLKSKLTKHDNCKHSRIKVHSPNVRRPHKADQNIKTIKRWETVHGKVDNNSNGKNENHRTREADEEIPTSETEVRCKKRQKGGERITVLQKKAGRPHKTRNITERSAFILRSLKDRKMKTDISVPGRQKSNTGVELVSVGKDTICERGRGDVKPMGLMAQVERNYNEYGEGQRLGQSQSGPSSEEFGGHVNLAPGDYIVPDLRVIKMEKDLWDDNSGPAT